jgi:AcrR family transcriptional regulator
MKDAAIAPSLDGDARQRLLDAAEKEFADRGFDGATVRDICRRAGANIASVNYYFGGKEALYIEAVKHAHSCSISTPLAHELPANASPVEKLRSFIQEMVRSMHVPASPTAMKLLMREMADPGKAAHVVVQEFIQPVAFRLQRILRELLPELAEPRILAIGFSIIGQVLFYRQNRPCSELIFGKQAVEALDLDLVTRHIVQFTLAALGYEEPISGPRRTELT